MEINKIVLLVEASDIQETFIYRSPSAAGKWQVDFLRKSTGQRIPLTARRQNTRCFASVDSAVKALEAIGIHTSQLDWKNP